MAYELHVDLHEALRVLRRLASRGLIKFLDAGRERSHVTVYLTKEAA